MGREKAAPLTKQMEDNLSKLIIAVSKVRHEYSQALFVTSGYRPASINAAVGGSKQSAHQSCQAVDIKDDDGYFANWCMNNLDILKKSGILGMEDPRYTGIFNKEGKRVGGWVHLDIRGTRSGNLVFIPYAEFKIKIL